MIYTDLLGDTIFLKAWGGLSNRLGRQEATVCSSIEEAHQYFEETYQRKKKRGYKMSEEGIENLSGMFEELMKNSCELERDILNIISNFFKIELEDNSPCMQRAIFLTVYTQVFVKVCVGWLTTLPLEVCYPRFSELVKEVMECLNHDNTKEYIRILYNEANNVPCANYEKEEVYPKNEMGETIQ